jgi:hypothetical protein
VLSEVKLLWSLCAGHGVLCVGLVVLVLVLGIAVRWLVMYRLVKIAIEKSSPDSVYKVVEAGASMVRIRKR